MSPNRSLRAPVFEISHRLPSSGGEPGVKALFEQPDGPGSTDAVLGQNQGRVVCSVACYRSLFQTFEEASGRIDHSRQRGREIIGERACLAGTLALMLHARK